MPPPTLPPYITHNPTLPTLHTTPLCLPALHITPPYLLTIPIPPPSPYSTAPYSPTDKEHTVYLSI